MTETKIKIIETMYELIANRGYDKASIGQISEIIGIKKPSVYYYFKSKEEILLETVETYCTTKVGVINDLDCLTNIEQYTHYLLDYGDKSIIEALFDLTFQKFCKEVMLQGERIEVLKVKLEEIDKIYKEEVVRIIQKGHELGALKQEGSLKNYVDLTLIVREGISTAIVYHLDVDPHATWALHVKNILV